MSIVCGLVSPVFGNYKFSRENGKKKEVLLQGKNTKNNESEVISVILAANA